jgi:Bacterial regulatory proteins, luxR family
VSENTVKTHSSRVFDKLGARRRTQAVQLGKFTQMYQNPLVNMALTLLEPLPVGIVFTLVSAGVLSRKREAKGEAVA